MKPEVGLSRGAVSSAHSYRAGLVFAPRFDQQFYFATSSSFTPVNTVPADGPQLEPSTARNYEVGHRWQGWNGRVDTTAALYYLVRNNVTIQQSVINFIQVGEQNSKGMDVDVNTDLGGNAFPGQPINVTTTLRLKWR